MRIKAKLRSIGTSKGIIIPAEMLGHYNVGDFIEIDVLVQEVPEVKEPKEEPKRGLTFNFNKGIYESID